MRASWPLEGASLTSSARTELEKARRKVDAAMTASACRHGCAGLTIAETEAATEIERLKDQLVSQGKLLRDQNGLEGETKTQRQALSGAPSSAAARADVVQLVTSSRLRQPLMARRSTLRAR